MSRLPINVRLLRTDDKAILPVKAHDDDSGFDVFSVEEIILYPGTRAVLDTGWKIALPEGYEAQVRSKSGLALKKGLVVLNSPGTIDAGYRGTLGVIILNTDRHEAHQIKVGDKIAQIVIQPVVQHVHMREVSAFDSTERGEGGFGSTGA